MITLRRIVLSLVVAIFQHQLQAASGAQQTVNVTILNPENLQDSQNNIADRHSNITFAPIQNDQNYKSTGKSKDDVGAIAPLYNLAESIVHTSLPGDFPLEWVSKIINGNIDIGNDWKEIVVAYLGYVIALAIGIVFFLIFPIVGACFCCCRCCGKCGGKRVIKAPEEAGLGDKCGRRTALGLLSLFTAMAFTGSVLMFVTNSNLSNSFNDLHNTDTDKIDDIPTFFDSTIEQAEKSILGKFNFTLAVLFRDLDNIGYLLGMPIRDHILVGTGLSDTYDSINNMEKDAKILHNNLQILDSNKTWLIQISDLFHNFTITMNTTVEEMAANYSSFNGNVTNRSFVTNFDAGQLPDETPKILGLKNSLDQGISSMTSESKQKLNDIPERVQNETTQQRSDLINKVNQYTDDIKNVTSDLRSMRDDVLKGIDFQNFKEQGKKYTDPEYEKYRWYAGLGIAGLMMLTVVLLALGLLCGLFGGNVNIDPTKRSSLSNAGGNLLIAGAILTFIFGWVVMFITTILFAAGAPVNKFGCETAQDLIVLDKVLQKIIGDGKKNGSWLGDMVYSGKGVNLKISELLQSCKNGETLYKSLKMEEANVFNLTDLTDYKKKFNINDQLGSINIGFDGINITTPGMKTFIDLMKNFDSQMNYTGYNSTLVQDPVLSSKEFLASLMNYSHSYTLTNPEKKAVDDVITNFTSSLSTYEAALENSKRNIEKALETIKNTTQQPPNDKLSDRCNKLELSLNATEQNLSNNASQAFNQSVQDFEARLTKILDTFIENLKNSVKNEIGNCRPIWNLYSDIIFGACSSTIGALGGWWCASGWTAFFLTLSLLASVKLSKHFRRMRYLPSKGVGDKNGSVKKHHFQNKVSHADKPNGYQEF